MFQARIQEILQLNELMVSFNRLYTKTKYLDED
jgi:hypothetical protein